MLLSLLLFIVAAMVVDVGAAVAVVPCVVAVFIICVSAISVTATVAFGR